VITIRPLRGREFFEEIVRENLDLGRPDRVQLTFDGVVTRNGLCRNARMAKIFTRRGNSSSVDRRVAAGVSQSIRVLLSARQG